MNFEAGEACGSLDVALGSFEDKSLMHYWSYICRPVNPGKLSLFFQWFSGVPKNYKYVLNPFLRYTVLIKILRPLGKWQKIILCIVGS